MRLQRRQFGKACGAVLLTSVFPHAGSAQIASPAWPTRAVKIVVPVAAGTATDFTARIFGDRLSAHWKQPVIIDNRPGADGLIAIKSFVSTRDDHALLFSFSTAVSLNPLLYSDLSYDPVIDLTPITTTTEVLFGVAVTETVPVSTYKEYVAYVRANPGKYNWAAAPGLPRYVLDAHLRSQQLDMVFVSYNQTPVAVQDLGEGRVQAMIGSVSVLVPILQAKKAKLLVIASTDRSGLADGVPSAVEAGFPDLAVPAVGCAFGWKGMPDALRDRIARDIDTVAQDPTMVQRFAQFGQAVRRSTPADLTRLLNEQRLAMGPLAAAMAAEKK